MPSPPPTTSTTATINSLQHKYWSQCDRGGATFRHFDQTASTYADPPHNARQSNVFNQTDISRIDPEPIATRALAELKQFAVRVWHLAAITDIMQIGFTGRSQIEPEPVTTRQPTFCCWWWWFFAVTVILVYTICLYVCYYICTLSCANCDFAICTSLTICIEFLFHIAFVEGFFFFYFLIFLEKILGNL